jgi:hypothetical protein
LCSDSIGTELIHPRKGKVKLSVDSAEVETIVEEMKADETFDLVEALNEVTYPKGEVTVYLDADGAQELNEVLAEISELGRQAAAFSAEAQGSMTDSPEKEAIDAEIETLQARQKELVERVSGSALTFHMRGVAPAAWRIMFKEVKRKNKPENKSEEALQEAQEIQIEKLDNELVAKSIIKVVNSKGAADSRAFSVASVEVLRDKLLQSEWERVLDKANTLTFANSVFHNVKAADADFLSQS